MTDDNHYLNQAYGPVPAKNMKTLLELSLSAARDEGFDLKPNADSLKDLESILRRLSKHLRTVKDEEQRVAVEHGAAVEYAAYIIWLIEATSHKVGKWFYHHKEYGKNVFPYVIADTVIFPYSWVLKFIEDPGHESLYDKYREFIK